MRPRTLPIIVALPASVALAAWWLLLVPPAVPEHAGFELGLAEVRRVALAAGGPLPTRVNVLVLAESEKPLVGALGGLRGGTFRMPWTAFQIAWADSFLVVDAPGAPDAERFADLQDALRGASAIVVSHEHPDHLGGVARSPQLAELLPRLHLSAEQLANSAALDEAGLPQDARNRLRPLSAERPLRIAPGVVLIGAPGHTPGSQIVYVRLENGRELLLVGDAAWHRLHFEEPRGHPRISAWLLGEDLPRVLDQLRALHEAWRHEGVIVVPSHDGEHLDALVASGVLRADSSGRDRARREALARHD